MLDAEKVKSRMSQFLNVKADKFNDDVALNELVVDSFILIDMVIDLQTSFNVKLIQEDLVNVKTVGDLIGVLKSKSN